MCVAIRTQRGATGGERADKVTTQTNKAVRVRLVCVLGSVRALGGEARRSRPPFSVGGLGMKAGVAVAASCHGTAEESRPL